MNQRLQALATALEQRFASKGCSVVCAAGEVTLTVPAADWLAMAETLRDDAAFQFDILIDLCGVDYLNYGVDEWQTESATATGFSRGVNAATNGRFTFHDAPEVAQHDGKRFASVVHLLSVSKNHRLRVKVFCEDDQAPALDSVVDVWSGANWFERESFDLYGIVYRGHPDLRRLLTDYGFVGHPFRKDFPLVGHVEMRYDEETKRVVYQPVSIEPRVLVPRVIRAEGVAEIAADEEIEVEAGSSDEE